VVSRRAEKLNRFGYLIAFAFVVMATALFYPGREHFAKAQWALLYQLIIAFVASFCGVKPALLAAALSFLAWNFFFIPPHNTFAVNDPKDWLSLLVFLAVGVLIGIQTGRLRERENEALAREKETALLNRFSAYLVSDISEIEMGNNLIAEVTGITGANCIALFLSEASGKPAEFAATPGAVCQRAPTVIELVEWVYKEAKAVGLPDITNTPDATFSAWPISVKHNATGICGPRNEIFLPLQTSTRQAGVLYIGERLNQAAYSIHEARLLVALANQAAIFLERRYLQKISIQADAAQEADRLKSILLSAVSHELKTPLSSMKAIVTNLLEGDVEWNSDSLHEEIQALQSDLNRLNSSIGSLVDLSRLEASEWKPQMEWYDFGEILGSVLADFPQRDRARIAFSLPEDLPQIRVDFPQWERVLYHLLENALLYSGDAPVHVGASATEKEVRMWVEDEGPGINPAELHSVFEKFYRGKSAANIHSGTGLGLAVTDEIIRFHGGRIWIENVKPHGARFVISLPRTPPLESSK